MSADSQMALPSDLPYFAPEPSVSSGEVSAWTVRLPLWDEVDAGGQISPLIRNR